jgi:hypothetical protein
VKKYPNPTFPHEASGLTLLAFRAQDELGYRREQWRSKRDTDRIIELGAKATCRVCSESDRVARAGRGGKRTQRDSRGVYVVTKPKICGICYHMPHCVPGDVCECGTRRQEAS